MTQTSRALNVQTLYCLITLLFSSLSVYAQPVITGFTPTSGPVGTSVTITGSGFDATPSNNIVYFGATKATVTAATASQLTVTVPVGAMYQPVSVLVNGLIGYSKLPFATTYVGWGAIDANTFVSKTDYSTGSGPSWVSVGDFDGDGKSDLAVINNGTTVSIYRNTSTGVGSSSFAAKVDYATGTTPRVVSVGDFDGDGKPDMAITNWSSNTVSVFRNTSTGVGSISFAAKVDYPTGTNPFGISSGDLDGDGRTDLAVTNFNGTTISLFRNTGTGPGSLSFASKIDYTIGSSSYSVSIGDLDGDGKADIATANYGNSKASVFRNTSTGIGSISFATKVDYSTGTFPNSISLGDLDGDGKLDMVVCGSVFRNTNTVAGTLSFAPKVDYDAGGSVSIGDLDGDGKPDLIGANSANNLLSALRNTSTGVGSIAYAGKVDYATGTNTATGSVSIGDFDGDGKCDLVGTNWSTNTISVLLHQRGARQTISSFDPFPSKALDDAAFSLNATASSGLPITYSSSNPLVATVSGSTITMVGYGTTVITAMQSGDSYYGPISISQVLAVGPFPAITNFNPASGPVGTSVTISGSGFSPIPSSNIVYFGVTKATVTAATASQLTVTVPVGATYQPISILVNGLLAYSKSPFATKYAGWGLIDPGSFVQKKEFTTGTNPYSISSADFDGDGKTDLAVANSGAATVSIFRNTSSGVGVASYAPKVDYATGTTPYCVSATDFDGDGKTDLMVANWGSNTVSIFRNTSNGAGLVSFDAKVDFITGTYPGSVAVGDFDSDGRVDLATANYTTSTVSILRNTSTGTGAVSFAAKLDYATGANPRSVLVGDIDGDGKVDLVTANYGGSSITIFRNTSTGMGSVNFAARVNYTTGANPSSVSIGDLDGDGKADLAASNYSGNTISVFRNTGTGAGSVSFAAKADYSAGTGPYSISIGDLDGDGKPDLGVANDGSNSISMLQNTSTGIGALSFAAKVDYITAATNIRSLSIGDFDGDGKVDLASANYSDATMSVILHSAGSRQTINSFNPFPTKAYGDPAFYLNATASSGLPVTYTSSNTSVATVSGNTVTIVGYGTTTIMASQAGDSYYGSVSASQVLAVGPFPSITDFAPTTGPVGTIVTINGTGFNTTASNNVVYFGATKATVRSATATQLLVTVPVGATYQPIAVLVNGLIVYSKSPFATTYLGWGAIDAGSFVSKTDFATGNNPYSISAGDFDGDGKTDLAVVNNGSTNVSIFRNTSSGIGATSYAAKINYTTGSSPTSVSVGDLDGDGKVDLAVANYSSNTVSVFRNTSTGAGFVSFAAKVDYNTGANPRSVSIGDLDGDGKADLATANYGVSTVSTLRNAGTGAGSINFAAKQDYATGLNPYSVTIVDIDGDGKVDLATANYAGNSVSILRNMCAGMGSVTFSPKVDYTVTGNPISISNGDFDGDGRADLAVANYTGNTVSVLRNTGTTTGAVSFTVKVDYSAGGNPWAVSIGDLDGDGKADLLAANYYGHSLSMFHNTSTSAGSVNFDAKVDYATGTYPSSVAIGDFDGDGKMDIAAGNSVNGTMSVILHKADQLITFNSLPSKIYGDAPFPLNATASSGLPVSYTSSNPLVASVSGNTVTILAAGSTTITASQSGNTNFRAAPDVSQPLMIKSKAQNNLDVWAFQYRYDGRKRMVQKKVPGADWVYLVYDDRDRLVLTQDGNQRANNQWMFTKYDALNRPVSTGIYSPGSSIDQATMQNNVNNYYNSLATNNGSWYESFSTVAGNVHYYDNKSFPLVTDASQYRTITYYDDNTTLQSLWGSNYRYTTDNLASGTYSQPSGDFRSVMGHPVASKTKLLDESNTWLQSITFYDDHYRVVQSVADNVKGGTDRISNLYDFVGKVIATKTTHMVSASTQQMVAETFDYDHAQRLLRTWHSVNGATPVVLLQNEYNEIGQLVDKKLHSTDNGTTFKQSNDYRYNIRGWLTSINDSQLAVNSTNDDSDDGSKDLFGMNLSYNEVISGIDNTPQFNGNISAIKWSNNQALDVTKDVAYKYSYDAMNRINSASHLTNLGTWTASSNFAENGFTYDLNGNIRSLTRTDANGATMDNLTYDYTGQGTTSNQLKSVTDAGDKLKGFADSNITGDDYNYDANGNMILDKNKNITAISYNHLNLPQLVTKSTGEKIVYTYDAGGRKLNQKVYDANGLVTKKTDYDGGFIYQNDTLQFINHEEGRVVMKGVSIPEYQYHLKDHLGNVRVTFTTTPIADTNTGTYETANSNTEQNKFLRCANARRINATIFDHTNGSSTGYSERLNGSANEKYGLARSISVMPGDVISTEVYAKYVDTNSSNWNSTLTTLMNQIASNTAGVVVDGSSYASSTSSFPVFTGGVPAKTTDTGGPKAYLNWLVFDRNYLLVTGGFKQLTTVAKETGTDVPHEYLSSGTITITQPGYVYIYLSNESPSLVEVYFDDFKVTQSNTLPVVQQEDFYPFGLTFNSYSRENSVPQNYLYSDKERINDLQVNWYDYGARMYMPEIGRWGVVDPLAEKLPWWTPYRYAFNNPLRFSDSNGKTEEERTKAIAFARSLRNTAYNTPISDLGYTIGGYQPLDCANLIRLSINESTNLGDLYSGKSNQSGVNNLLEKNSLRKVDINDIRDGDVVVMKSGDDVNGHTGFVTDVVKDEKGNVLSYKILHAEVAWSNSKTGQSGGGKVNDDFTVYTNKKNHYANTEKYQHRFYQWDTPDGKEDSKGSDQESKSGGDKKDQGFMTWQQAFEFLGKLLELNPNIKINFN